MRVHASAFWAPKAGSTDDEYEDAFWAEAEGEQRGARLRWAVADGASESFLAGGWARLVVETCGRPPLRSPLRAIADALGSWDSFLAEYVREREEKARPLQWFEEPKVRAGAFCTLLTLDLFDTPPASDERRDAASGTWRSIAMGDSCLFQVRDEAIVTAFPLRHSASFGSTPPLLTSRPPSIGTVRRRLARHKGSWRLDDTFYLGTDAIACWFLRSVEHGERPWEHLRDLGTDAGSDFRAFIAALRCAGTIRNDDVTLLRIDIL